MKHRKGTRFPAVLGEPRDTTQQSLLSCFCRVLSGSRRDSCSFLKTIGVSIRSNGIKSEMKTGQALTTYSKVPQLRRNTGRIAAQTFTWVEATLWSVLVHAGGSLWHDAMTAWYRCFLIFRM